MHLYNGQTQAPNAQLSSAVQETHPRNAINLFFSLNHSNRKRKFGVRKMDGFLGPDGMTNVPGRRRCWRLDTEREQKAKDSWDSYLEEAPRHFQFG